MSLDKQLREVLRDEGLSRTPPPPDLDRLIGGGRARRRRRSAARAGMALASVALIGGTAYGLGQADLRTSDGGPDTASQPTSVAGPDGRSSIEPGTHTYSAGTASSGKRLEFEVTLEGPGWVQADQPLLIDGVHAAGTAAYRPELVAAASACSKSVQGERAALTPRGLARQLARLPQGTVLEPPTPTRILGHRALHLSMRIGAVCPASGYYVVAIAETDERGVSYTEPPTDVLIEFWVVDLDGTTVVVDQFHDVDAPQSLVDRVTDARESIDFLSLD